MALLENAVVRYTATGQVPGPLGARHPAITPFEPFETADGLLIIAAGNDGLFVKLVQALGLGGLAEDKRFATNDLRNQHADTLKAMLEAVLKASPRAHWVEILDRAGIPCGPINTVDQALAHPQVAARNMLVGIDDPIIGPLKVSGNPLKIEGFEDPATRPPAPELDADRAKLLAELGL